MATVKDILTFHNQDLTLYNHILPLTQSPCDARAILSLWMYLELLGINVIPYLAAACHDPTLLRYFIAEANSILDALRPGSWAPLEPPYSTLIPFTAELVEEMLTLGFFYWNSGFVVRGIMGILDGVGRVLFDEELKGKFEGYRATVERGEMPEMPPELTERYEVRRRRRAEMAEERRSMFVAFASGRELRWQDIVEYFNEKWGDCIEKVVLGGAPRTVLPINGRVVFRSESCVDLLLRGEYLVKFSIKGSHLLARRYLYKSTTPGIR